ncbi:CU044_2847 family protein [Nostoc sphaeroides]|uniref:Trypsin-co-occurring domain-containing protein n=1 Tax=Nostoc sphaeroides CCNUC1 TaxID=2653204 RepID=A0A5P8WHE9_9NOSO|nr:CU044_2847 family protein [Nostoc sphaeroides]QFS52114.1 hypothetical protein GXM_09608 [Nostoc sphaeroides CCNUC1]
MENLKSTKLIELKDGLYVEVEVPKEQATQISGGLADRVDKTIDTIKPVLIKLCHPVSEALQEIKNLQLPVKESEASVELNLSFTAEGNVYITKFQSNSSLKITLKFKP